MFTWAKAVVLAFSLLSSLVSWMRERKLVSQAEDALLKRVMEAQDKAIKEAEDARAKASRANAAVPVTDSLPNDGYRRD